MYAYYIILQVKYAAVKEWTPVLFPYNEKAEEACGLPHAFYTHMYGRIEASTACNQTEGLRPHQLNVYGTIKVLLTSKLVYS